MMTFIKNNLANLLTLLNLGVRNGLCDSPLRRKLHTCSHLPDSFFGNGLFRWFCSTASKRLTLPLVYSWTL